MYKRQVLFITRMLFYVLFKFKRQLSVFKLKRNRIKIAVCFKGKAAQKMCIRDRGWVSLICMAA